MESRIGGEFNPEVIEEIKGKQSQKQFKPKNRFLKRPKNMKKHNNRDHHPKIAPEIQKRLE